MVRYAGWFDIWTDFPETVRRVAARPGVTRVCDLGGGANPVLSLEQIAELRLRYEVVDVSPDELAKTPAGYVTVEADALGREFARTHGPYDLITSGFVA